MDPADPTLLAQTLTAQGALLGQHDKMLHQIMEALNTLSSNVSQLAQQVTGLVRQPPADSLPPAAVVSKPPAAEPAQPPSSHNREPFVPPPEHYSSDVGACSTFLLQCLNVFDLQQLGGVPYS